MARASKGDRWTIAAKPARPLADVIRKNADDLNMSYGDYLVSIAARALDMPECDPLGALEFASLNQLDGLSALGEDNSPAVAETKTRAARTRAPRRPSTERSDAHGDIAEELRQRIAS